MRRLSIQVRLLMALSVLAGATLIVGIVAWIALGQGSDRLERLHGDTLARVDTALRLSRQSARLATEAPYLLTLDSPYRIAQEGAAARDLLREIEQDLAADHHLTSSLEKTHQAIEILVAESGQRAALRDQVLRLNAELARAERHYAAQSASGLLGPAERQSWLTLQGQAAALLGAGRAENLIGVGEYHRQFAALVTGAAVAAFRPDPLAQQRLRELAEGSEGLFELRRLELASRLRAEAAHVRIRLAAEELTAHAAAVTAAAQDSIAAERTRATTAIAVAKSTILTVGAASAIVALLAAVFVSQYVIANLRRVSDAMMRLASGDRQARLPRGEGQGDEIGKLFHAFRVFRANAIRLDRSNRQMTQRTALFENMMSGISDGVAILSDQGTIIAHNDRLTEMLRLDCVKLGGRPKLAQITSDAGWKGVAVHAGDTTIITGDDRHLDWRESPLPDGGVVVLVADVTERRKIEDRLQQIQRIEALGKVSGEVAHDFGNILSTISGNLHLLQTGSATRKESMYQTISSAVDLGISLTGRLLSFARRQHLAPETVDLTGLVEGMGDLIGFALRDTVEFHIQIEAGALPVLVDPGQLESAILNLCLNAGQAIEGSGTITLRVMTEADQAIIEVADTGSGMSTDVLAHAMEPFFSAREGGTGLGLAMVYGFMRQSGGDVSITSQLGRGTTVRLTLPLHDSPAIAPAAPLPGLGTVMIVEDDPSDMEVARQILVHVSERVLCCTHAAEALNLLAQMRVDLIVSDLSLQGNIEGWALARAALETGEQVRAIIVSGHLPGHNPLEQLYAGRLWTVSKPLTAEKVARARHGITPSGVPA